MELYDSTCVDQILATGYGGPSKVIGLDMAFVILLYQQYPVYCYDRCHMTGFQDRSYYNNYSSLKKIFGKKVLIKMATAEDNSFDEILNGKPTLAELCKHVPISTNWYIMGTQLELDVKKLNEIEDLFKPAPYKVSKMYELWLDTKPHATRKQVLDTLKMEAVGQMCLALQYEKKLKDHIPVIGKCIKKLL